MIGKHYLCDIRNIDNYINYIINNKIYNIINIIINYCNLKIIKKNEYIKDEYK